MRKSLKKLKKNLFIAILQFIKYLPFNLIIKLRSYCYHYLFESMGSCMICDGVTILNPSNMRLGTRVSIHPNVYIVGAVSIGDNVGIASKCSIIAQTHNYSDSAIPFKDQGTLDQPILIGSDVWIGANSVILGGTKIGDGAIIGAGSVVSGDIPPYSVVMGNPARVFFNRKKQTFNK